MRLPAEVAFVMWAAVAQAAKLIPFEQGERFGYRTAGGKVVIPPRYQVAQEFSREGLAAVVDGQGWAYIDRSGKVVIRPFPFDNGPDYFREGLARFTVDGKFGFFDRRGKVVIPPRFTFAGPFSEGRAAVCQECREVRAGEHTSMVGGKWGYIDTRGVLVIPLQFESAMPFKKGIAEVTQGSRQTFIDLTGRVGREAPGRKR
jgi:hypothetical protein